MAVNQEAVVIATMPTTTLGKSDKRSGDDKICESRRAEEWMNLPAEKEGVRMK
jgi:hypothetical protein